MDTSSNKRPGIFVSIEVGNKKQSSTKKKTPPKKKDTLLKGQLTLTQMPCMTPVAPVAATLLPEDNSDVASLSVFEEPNSPTGKIKSETVKFDSVKPAQEVDDNLTVIYTQNKEEEEVVFTVGDLVEMKHWVLDHYVQFGLVKQHHGDLIEVSWVWYAYDGNNDLVCVPKRTTVNPTFLKKLANFDQPLDPSQFNWWKFKGVMTHFDFFADGRGWRFKNMSW